MDAGSQELITKNEFSVFVPAALEVIEKAGEDVEVTRPIGGWCSTEELDRQDEIVVAKGLDFSEFVQFGWFNDNHNQATNAALGFPRLARLEKGRWWTEGNLIAGYPPADQIWSLAKALAKANAPRKLGFSIEGKVLERDGRNKILRAKIRDVAITRMPVNTSCSWSVLAKSFAEPAAVEAAALKALTVSTGRDLVPEDLERQQVTRDGVLSFGEAKRRIKERWPYVSDAVARRAAVFAMTKE